MRARRASLLGLLTVLATAACTARSVGPTAQQRIERAEKTLARHPRHYPAAAELALARLDDARRTLDPQMVQAARDAAMQSLHIQANLEAYKAMAAIEGFAHRFALSLDWAQRARQTLPGDSETTARAVEALLGLGRREEARRLLGGDAARGADFYTLTSLAAVSGAEGDHAAAATIYERAAAAAAAQHVPALALWAHIMSAAAWLDGARYPQAEAALARAALFGADSPLLALQRAELLAATDQPQRAAALYAGTLRHHPDAEGYRRAMVLALASGDRARAGAYRRRAEEMLLPALRAGEVYTLGELARLYRDAGIHLQRAAALAEENLRYVRDREARETLRSIRALRERAGRGAGTAPPAGE
jgi:hypothetical protein